MTLTQTHSWYEFIKDFAGPLATLFAASAAMFITFHFGRIQSRIASAQADIALDKLKHDLFERRYEIYSAAKLLLESVIHVGSLNGQDSEKIRTLYVKLDESRFFFPSEIQQYLQRLHDGCERLLRLVGEQEIVARNDDAKRSEYADRIGAISLELHTMYGELPKQFENALRFSQVTSK